MDYLINNHKSNDAALSTLEVVDHTLIPAFDPATTEYTVNVANNVTKIVVIAVANHANAQIEGAGSHDLIVGANVIVVTVTAEDGTEKNYTLTVNRAASSDANLSTLEVVDHALIPAFDPATTEYIVNVTNNVTEIVVIAVANHANAQVEGAGSHNLTVGANVIVVTVTAEDGTEKNYTLTVNRAASSDASLSTLEVVDHTLIPAFDPATTEYTVNVANNVTKIIIIAVANHTNAQVEGAGSHNLTVGANVIVLTVTAEDNTKKNYTLTVNRAGITILNETFEEFSVGPLGSGDNYYSSSCGTGEVNVMNDPTSSGMGKVLYVHKKIETSDYAQFYFNFNACQVGVVSYDIWLGGKSDINTEIIDEDEFDMVKLFGAIQLTIREKTSQSYWLRLYNGVEVQWLSPLNIGEWINMKVFFDCSNQKFSIYLNENSVIQEENFFLYTTEINRFWNHVSDNPNFAAHMFFDNLIVIDMS
ncbi:MAG: cadherin-like beta sandwich domain-containing protein [Promethearchaeota archaeon]